MFNFTFPELAAALLVVVVVFGMTKAPDRDGQRPDDSAPAVSRWSRSDWARVIAVFLAVAACGALRALR